MHEISLAQSIVNLCEKYAQGRRVTAVHLQVGELAGVVPEALEFCFPACARGTALEGARLLIERTQATITCRRCGKTGAIGSLFDPCPGCGSLETTMVTGEELRVKEMEVED